MKLPIKKRTIILFAFMLLSGLGFFFKGNIVHFGLKCYVLHKIPLEGQWEFNYSYLSLGENGVAFHDVVLAAADGSASCKVGKIFYKKPELETISFTNYFLIEDLELSFSDQMVTGVSLTATQIRSILSFLRQVEIKHGVMHIPNHKIEFSLAKSTSAEKLGELIFFEEGQGQIRAEFSTWANSWLVDLETRQSRLSFYKEFMDFFMGDVYADVIIEKGKFDGRAFIAIGSDNSVKDARVHMNLLDGKICNRAAGIVSSFDRVFIDLKYPTGADEKSFIENVKLSSSMDKGEITAYNKEGMTRFAIKDLSGFMTLDSFKKADVEFSGFIEDGDRLLPISLVGKPAEKNRKGLELDLSLQLDPVFGQQAHINMVCLHRENDFLVKSRLDSLELRQMLVLQVGLGLLHSGFKDYTINKGSYSCDLQIVFGSCGIKDFSIKNLSCTDFGIYSEKNDIGLEAKQMKGQFEFDLFKDLTTAVPFWETELVDANLVIGKEEGPAYFFEHVNMKASAKNGSFIDTSITGEINGTKGLINIDGSIESPIVDLMMTAKANDALHWFGVSEKSYNHELMLSSRLEKQGSEYTGSGVATIASGTVISEVRFDTRGTCVNDLMVQFSSKQFSGTFFPFINEITRFSWSLDGNYAFNGTYKNGDVDLYVNGDQATYRQKHSYIKNAKGSAHFVQDAKDQSWKIDISLKGGQKKIFGDKNLFLENADIFICNRESFLQIRDLQAYMDIDELGAKVLASANQFDIDGSGEVRFDLALKNSDFELCRAKGSYKDNKVLLGEYSHFLDNEIVLQRADFSEGIHIDVECPIDFKDVIFPRFLREQQYKETRAKLVITNDDICFETFLNEHAIKIEKRLSEISLWIDDEQLTGKIGASSFCIDSGQCNTPLCHAFINSCVVTKEGFLFDGKLTSDQGYFSGTIEGVMKDMWVFSGRGMGGISHGKENKYYIDSLEPFSFTVDKKTLIQNGKFSIRENDQLLGQLFAKSIGFHDGLNKISFHEVEGTTFKEVLSDKLGVFVQDEKVQFTAEADILPFEGDFWFSGHLDQKIFTVYEREINAKSIHIRGNRHALVVDCKVPIDNKDIDVTAHLFLDDTIVFHIDGQVDSKQVLDVRGSYRDELEIFRLKGSLCGVEFDVTASEVCEKRGFNAQMHFDFSKMRSILPEAGAAVVEKLGLAKGINLIGEMYFDKTPYFDGLIQGSDFDFLGYSISSLFGKILLKDNVCTISDFSIADRSVVSECKEAVFDARHEGVEFFTKNLSINNLRPCLLAKKGERKKISNPFMIEKIEFNEVQGNLLDRKSIKGKGSISFVNTFDKQTNPFFSFAKEIIGRIGLDPVVMIPVFGEVDFSLEDEKIHFLKMQNCFSDAGRSHFYLWHKSKSFLDFDGNIHLDIRMKQYVLFKFAELFIISLDGPLSSPKVYLK